MATDDTTAGEADEVAAVSPKDKTMEHRETRQRTGSMNNCLDSIQARADPDAQATVTDFLDFTEYLPSDMVRSLTLIGKLDQAYSDASEKIHEMTTTWGQLPNLPADERPSPVQLRADISEALRSAVGSRSFSHAEAARMSENVNRHYNRAKTILSKLQSMMENYPTAEEQKSPVAVSKSPQVSRASKPALRGADGEKIRRPVAPRITVPGEVLAPYDHFEFYTSDSDESSDDDDDDDDIDAVPRRTPARATPAPRIKLLQKQASKPYKSPKTPHRAPKPGGPGSAAAQPAAPMPAPPPENAAIGSADAPWLQLTPWEMAQLRKKMKKNSTWTPSDTMISRELNSLGRGIDAYREAKKKAEEEGRFFDPAPIAVAAESGTGSQKTPEGALSAAALQSDEVQLSNRGMKLNEAKKLKRESLAKQAAEEAEESARRFNETAWKLMAPQQPQQPQSSSRSKSGRTASIGSRGASVQGNGNGTGISSSSNNGNGKRKRDSVAEGETSRDAAAETPSTRPPPMKRTKTETPVPLPQLRASISSSQPLTETPIPPPVFTPGGTAITPHSETPVPVPVPGQDAAKRNASPAVPKEGTSNTVTTTVPLKPAADTLVPLPPVTSPKKSTTPIFPPVRDASKRETRGAAAAAAMKTPQEGESPAQQSTAAAAAATQPQALQQQQPQASAAPTVQRSVSRSRTRSATPAAAAAAVTADGAPNRAAGRPASRGKAASQEPQLAPPLAATDRTRRASTARNTPAPSGPAVTIESQSRPLTAQKRGGRRPAPGIVSTTTSGGSSAVGRRKKAPSVKKRVRAQKRDGGSGPPEPVEEVEEVDDEGNAIDPDEPRYCVCNGVSYGTMISCDNTNCPAEWFHLECVNLPAIPARTTKWYCPDCRVRLNIGEKGEVNARGVKT